MRGLAAAILAVALVAPGAVFAQQTTGKDSVYRELNLFSKAFERIHQDSVDPVAGPKLIHAAIDGLLSGLDPRASYITPAELKAMKSPANGNADTLGLVVTLDDGVLTVVSPRDGSPAAKAGLKPGDAILAIGKEPTFDLDLAEAEQKLRGPAGSKVTLTLRHETGGPVKVTITRAAYKEAPVTSHLDGGDIGYIRLAGFAPGTPAALDGAVADLRHQAGNKLIGYVLDLRNDPGGNFDAAVAVADSFINHGDIAVIKGRKASADRHIAAKPGDIAKGLPIVALINGGTAREAELVAAALHGNHRAVLIGTKTFGDSAMLSLIPLQTGGAIRLTTARFLAPAGQEIEGKGIAPDLVVKPLKIAKLTQRFSLREADLRGALKNPQKKTAAPGTPPDENANEIEQSAAPSGNEAAMATSEIGSARDEQLTEAIDVLRGLAVVRGASG